MKLFNHSGCPSRTETMWPPFLAMPGTPHAEDNERALLGAFCLFVSHSARDSDSDAADDRTHDPKQPHAA